MCDDVRLKACTKEVILRSWKRRETKEAIEKNAKDDLTLYMDVKRLARRVDTSLYYPATPMKVSFGYH